MSELKVIEPRKGWSSLNLRELWNYRDLLGSMVWRDISVRYRQSVLGIAWAIFRPAFTAMIYTLVFSIFVKIETPIPYPLFAYAALIPWLYFSTALTTITASVTASSGLLKKVYFPRLILPIAALCPGLLEIAIQTCIVGVLMVFYRYVPSVNIVFLPVFIFLAFLNAFAFGIWLTTLNVKFRDVGMSVPFFLQIWMYLCPIVYPLSVVPEAYRLVYSLNPMVGLIEGFRWSLFSSGALDVASLVTSFCVLLAILVSGLYFFKRSEAEFADIV